MATKESKKGAARSKRSKEETQEEFARLQEAMQAAREDGDAKTIEVTRLHEAEVRQRADGLSVETVVQKISGLGLEVSRALAEVSEKLTEEVRQLAMVREAVAIERRELEQLHKIDVAATVLDQLVQDHAREKQRLEAEIATQRAAWVEETTRVERERKEQEDGLKKARQREIEDYEYRKTLERKKAQDAYDEGVRAREKKNQEQQEALEKGWQLREAALKEQEEVVARLKKEVDEFPQRLGKETEAAAVRGRREAEARLEQQMQILKKDAEAEKRLAELRVKTLEEALAHNVQHIAALERQVADAKQQVQDIAVKAIEGASGAKALSHINQIAMEQAKTARRAE